ncbi:SDR family NAD(P)-dependent oxidoreductase [Streptomyces sp. NBC_01445]|uniref:SDR family NAD(P)-dependent oxidoreductase n=1 Tax=Streptomyces sp. NBC_01445 TaxID=2903869 RepID=UPI002DDB10E1|nr:SDR family NAD(P)-dependent oxidoreductase [Streptomyces sp. NBC_01445]WSE11014.1 SDR family NAD(P)-dependent oxidoreductase [Streptomyces sp. NBC_01445]
MAASDATIVINNAGIQAGPALLEGSLEGARRELEVNYLGAWAVSRAFAPVLAANGGGALVNMLSVASWRVNNRWPSYAASKAAEWSLTNALRVGLRQQGTLVVGVHVGPCRHRRHRECQRSESAGCGSGGADHGRDQPRRDRGIGR